MNISKNELRSLQARLNGLASLFGAAEMGLIELNENTLRNAKDSAELIAADLDEHLMKFDDHE